MEKPFRIAISNGQTASAIRVESPEYLASAMDSLGFHAPRPILVILGGAAKMDEDDFNRLKSFFKVLTLLVEELGASVVDGGTDFGVMQMIGQARAEISATFSLIGVTPEGLVAVPGETPPQEAAPLEPNHTHFVLIPGTNWGDESPWLASVATVLAKGARSVAVLVNGGEISLIDVSQSIKANRRVLVVAGSGRLADTLNAALMGETTDEEAMNLAASGLVQSIDYKGNLDSSAQVIKSYLD